MYKTSPLDGSLEPHVFERFERISYLARFGLSLDDAAPKLYVDDDLSVRNADAVSLASYLTTGKSTTRWFEDSPPDRRHNTVTLKIKTCGRRCKVMKAQGKHLKIIGDLKEGIENNWVVKHGPQQ